MERPERDGATIGAYEAKTHLPQLLARVERGERITITRHGKPVAVLVPAQPYEELGELWQRWLERSKHITTGGMSIKEMIEEGRRY